MLLPVLSGCGNGSSVSGKVAFEDGTPLNVGLVQFENESGSYSGRIEKNGSYKVTGASIEDGIPNGNYSVAIVRAFESIPGKENDGYGTVRNLIDEKFTRSDTSELSCSVQGKTTFDITVAKP